MTNFTPDEHLSARDLLMLAMREEAKSQAAKRARNLIEKSYLPAIRRGIFGLFRYAEPTIEFDAEEAQAIKEALLIVQKDHAERGRKYEAQVTVKKPLEIEK
jgi:hypothetical protein